MFVDHLTLSPMPLKAREILPLAGRSLSADGRYTGLGDGATRFGGRVTWAGGRGTGLGELYTRAG